MYTLCMHVRKLEHQILAVFIPRLSNKINSKELGLRVQRTSNISKLILTTSVGKLGSCNQLQWKGE